MTYGDDPLDDDSPSEPTIDALMLDEATADRLLEQPESTAPPGYAKVARLLSLVGAPALREELAGEQLAVVAFLGARPAPARSRWRGRVAMSSLAGVILLSGGVAAAATGSLPGPAQDAIARALDHVGVDVPMSNGQSVSDGTPDKAGTVSGSAPTDTKTTGIDNGAGNGGVNHGGNGNHTGVSQPPGQANDHTKTTGADNGTGSPSGAGTGNGGTNQGGNGNHTGVTNPHPTPTQPPQAKTNIKVP
jgi:hypothetical protein